MRTTTSTQETIEPPSFPGDPTRPAPLLSPPLLSPKDARSGFGRFRRHSNASSAGSHSGSEDKKSGRLHFGRTRSSTSVNVPDNLPDVGGDGVARNEEDEAQWEKRATVLVMNSALAQGSSAPPSPALEAPSPTSPSRPGIARKPSVAAPADEVGWAGRESGLGWAGLRLRRRIFRRRYGCTKKAVSLYWGTSTGCWG
jgi:hypothetical protein